jgi:putative ABC transport system ATP-binding protein
MMRELNVELRDLGRTFENTHVFSHIDLEVAKGEAAAIMGPSGLGKTTLLRIIGTLDVPTRGEVKICGEDVLSMDKSELADLRWERIGFSFQEPTLLPGLSVLDNVLLPCFPRIKGEKLDGYREKATDLLASLGLGERLNYRPHQISVGQKKRADMARALINDPDVIIVDEPTTNLDSESAEIISGMLRRVVEEGRTVVLTTHVDQSLLDLSKVRLEIQDYQSP